MSLAAVEDMELVRRFVAGEQDCFLEIHRRYRGFIFSMAFDQLRDRGEAEEVANDTLMAAYRRGLARFRGDCLLKTWFYRVALNFCRNRYWKGVRRKTHLSISLDSPINDGGATVSEIIPSPELDSTEELEFCELSDNVGRALAALPTNQRIILTMRVVENRRYEEIASLLGISVGTVKSRINRARIVLRAGIEEMNSGQAQVKAA